MPCLLVSDLNQTICTCNIATKFECIIFVIGTFATDFLDSREAPFSSVIVLVLTSLWSYFLTNLVMSDNKKDKTV